MPGQLVFPFEAQAAFGREDFIVAPCNEQAFRFIDRWPDWSSRTAAIHGPHGSGKSHLTRIWCAKANAEFVSVHLLNGDDVAKLSEGVPVAVQMGDVAADAPTEERDRALIALFERPAGETLFSALTPPSEWPVAVADLRSRFDSLLAFPLWAPDDTLLEALIGKQFADRQLEVPLSVIRKIMTHVERSPQAIKGFVARADLKALAEKRAITDRLVLELIEAEQGAQTPD